jgi:hypothetical protein
MNVIEESGENAPRSEPLISSTPAVADAASVETADASTGSRPSEGGADSDGNGEPLGAATSVVSGPNDAAVPSGKLERRRLEEQLEALKRKELELRRALVIADHPALAEGIRVLEGRTYALGRIEAKLAEGMSKSEARRSETIEKKLSSLREKRAELDTQIAGLELELRGLGAERLEAFAAERHQALEQLLVALGKHEPALREAGIDAASLVPEIARWAPEVQALAESLVAARDATRSERASSQAS